MSGSLFTPRGLWAASTPADRWVSLAMLGLAFASSMLVAGGNGGPAVAVVSVGRSVVAELPLSTPGTFTVEGRLGSVELEIADGSVRVVRSGCPNRLCIAMGDRRHTGDLIACVPNALLVRVTGGRPDADAPDAVSR